MRSLRGRLSAPRPSRPPTSAMRTFSVRPPPPSPSQSQGVRQLSVLSTCVTKQTGDKVYSEARRLRMLGIWARTTMLYVERDSDHGSTFAVFVELSEGRDVGSGPMPRVWDLASPSLPLDQ